MATEKKFGVIDEDSFTLISPRAIDDDECNTLEQAFDQARKMIVNGTEKVSIVEAVYDAAQEVWVEVPGRSILVESYDWPLGGD